jgi:hypothetical protein
MQRLFGALHGPLGSYLRDTLQKGYGMPYFSPSLGMWGFSSIFHIFICGFHHCFPFKKLHFCICLQWNSYIQDEERNTNAQNTNETRYEIAETKNMYVFPVHLINNYV